MNRCRLLLPIGATLIVALTAHAQHVGASADGSAKSVSSGEYAAPPTVETQLKVLTEMLVLTADQQDKIKPILQDLHDATERLMQDKSLSREERLTKVRPERYKADERIRAALTEEQKKKLDEYEQGPHSEMHGPLSGATTRPARD
jgi:Spy/CpxP family protein refolding chaperone